MIRFIVCAVFICLGLFFEITAVIGVYRFDTALRRMHAAALGDTMGLFFIVLGLIVAEGLSGNLLKYAMLVLLLWNTSPIASHLIGKLEYETNEALSKEVETWKS
ncbi:MAG: monovalent cation/H(+) antiporter subunit G [Clostridia bacterium]|nr:monovalent cation/H(+) antiporter subunit G [Clostridia bacterium]